MHTPSIRWGRISSSGVGVPGYHAPPPTPHSFSAFSAHALARQSGGYDPSRPLMVGGDDEDMANR